jgi:anti-anti-sigma factor
VSETFISLQFAAGALTIENADRIRQLFSDALNNSSDLALDLGEVQSCDAAGLQLICSLYKSAAERRRRVRIAALSPAVEGTAAVLGLSLQEITGETGRSNDHGL